MGIVVISAHFEANPCPVSMLCYYVIIYFIDVLLYSNT